MLSYSTEPRFDAPGFEGRDGFLFIGCLLEPKAPDCRDLTWFLQEAWPLICAKLPDAAITVAGHIHHSFCELQVPGVRLVEPAAELRPLYDAARILVAPSFPAGMPVIILEAIAAGLPTVTTRPMARQLGLTPRIEVAAADEPALFAAAAIALHENRVAWTAMRAAAQERVAHEYSAVNFRLGLRTILGGK